MFSNRDRTNISYLYNTEVVTPSAHLRPDDGDAMSMNFIIEVTLVGFTNLGYKFFIVFAAIHLCLLTLDEYFAFRMKKKKKKHVC